MSLLKTSVESPPAVPLKVRMEPYLVESLCELARLVRDKGVSNREVSGLLFGRGEPGVRSVEALKTFVDMGAHSELARRQRWERAYRATAEEAKNDPELSQFEIVGWFSFRSGSGLISSDLTFHNQHFRKPEDVALIVWREGPSQVTVEVYSKSGNDTMTSDDCRWGSVRLSADIRHMREPVELAMRTRLSDDSDLRSYDDDEPVTHMESLRRRAETVTNKLFGFLNSNKDEAQLGEVKGLIGDGRTPGRSAPRFDSIEPLPNPQSYFNPYSDPVTSRNRRNVDAAAKPSGASAGATPAAPSPAPLPPAALPPAAPVAAWPSSGSGVGTAPARTPESPRAPETARAPESPRAYEPAPAPELRPDVRLTDGNLPRSLPPTPAGIPGGLPRGYELMQIGAAPRSGRTLPSEIGGLPMLLRPPAPPRQPAVWPWAVGICLVCSSLVFGFLALGGLQGENGRLGQLVESLFPGNSLNLRVRNEDERLRLSWNPRNHTVASATDATLQIFDGQISRDIHLDGRQVADGSVLYRPLSNDITFRLEVHGDQGSTTGSVRVLDGLSGRTPTLDVSSAAQETSARNSNTPPVGDPAAPTLLPLAGAGPTPGDGSTLGTGSTPSPSSTTGAGSTPVTGSTLAENGASATTNQLSSAAPADVSATPKKTDVPLPDGTEITRAPSQSSQVETPPRTAAGLPKKRSKTRYETPETIGTIRAANADQPIGGTTINGWDAVPTTKSGRTRPSGSFLAPRPLAQVTPNVRSIPAGTIPVRTRVAVEVGIDSLGHVTSARVLTSGVNSKVSAAALTAARQWVFDPAESNGRRITSQHTIVFEFPVR